MKITILTLFPTMVSAFLNESIVKRAQEAGHVEIEVVDLRTYGLGEYRQVDDRPYGGGAGMVLRVDVLDKALRNVISTEVRDLKGISRQARNDKVVLTSAKGTRFNQEKARELAKLGHLVIVAGHYEGVDERALALVDEEVSLGDFVMTGGEIAAAAITDAVVRLQENVLKKEDATQEESFFTTPINQLIGLVGEDEVLKKLQAAGVKEVTLLEYPHYTRPEEYNGEKVPEILLGGDHKKIQEWRLKKAYEETLKKRPDLLEVSS